MKKSYKVIIINVIGALLFSIAFGLMMGEAAAFLAVFGAVSGILGFVNLIGGITLIALRKNEWSQAFFISCGVLFLLGVGICGPIFLFM